MCVPIGILGRCVVRIMQIKYIDPKEPKL